MTDENKPAALDPLDMAAKRQLHEKADVKNRIETRGSRLVLVCGENRKKGVGYCRSVAGMGTDHPGYGRCKFCFGNGRGPKTPEGKAKIAQNGRKHGFYSHVLSAEEREAYEEQMQAESLGLQHEVYLLKAKILLYLKKWKKRWEAAYEKKLAERFVKYTCKNVAEGCDGWVVRGELEPQPGYCLKCGGQHLEQTDSWAANRTPEEAELYADKQTRVIHSEGEGGTRTFGHAGSLDDKVLNSALNTLSRLVRDHARLNSESGDDLMSSINKELQQASAGRVSISWGGKPQTRKGAPAE